MAKSQVLECRCIWRDVRLFTSQKATVDMQLSYQDAKYLFIVSGQRGRTKMHQSILDTNSMCLKWSCSGHVTSDVAEKDWVPKSEILGVFQILCLYTYTTANAILVSQLLKRGQGILMIWELWSHTCFCMKHHYVYTILSSDNHCQ